jgi:uncharacterized membrane protein
VRACVVYVVVLGTESRALCMLGEHTATDLIPSPGVFFIIFKETYLNSLKSFIAQISLIKNTKINVVIMCLHIYMFRENKANMVKC